MSDAALSGIRVLDLTTVVFGPYAAQLLADQGADVVKIEAPQGDPVRSVGPGAGERMAALYLGFNRNKRSVVLNLKRPAGVEALLRLVDTADVFVHNMRPQKAAALGLAPDTLRERNDRLVYAALTGFGAGGAYAGRPAYDDTIQGLSGAADLMRHVTGEPRYLPTILADKVSGVFAAHAILAALLQRERTGRGQVVEVPMFEVATAFVLAEHYHARHRPAEPSSVGYSRALEPWRRPFATLDGYVCLLPYDDGDWRHFFLGSGRPELAADPRFTTLADRTSNVAALYSAMAEIVAGRTTEYWLAFAARWDIPASPVNRLDELEDDPHLRDVGFFVDVADGAGASYRFARSPIRLSDSRVEMRPPPRLGADSVEVLRAAGLTDAEVEAALS
jgi:crotonobetainyl-CoA:carnitine CoA-transferase CaiB-like acyl-CoA transferase